MLSAPIASPANPRHCLQALEIKIDTEKLKAVASRMALMGRLQPGLTLNIIH